MSEVKTLTQVVQLAMDIEEQRMVKMTRPLIATILACAKSMDDADERLAVAEFALEQRGLPGELFRHKHWNIMIDGFSHRDLEKRIDKPMEGYVDAIVEFGEVGIDYPDYQHIIVSNTPSDPLDPSHPIKFPRMSREDKIKRFTLHQATQLERAATQRKRLEGAQQGLDMVDSFEEWHGLSDDALVQYAVEQYGYAPTPCSNEGSKTAITHIYMIGLWEPKRDSFLVSAFRASEGPYTKRAIIERADSLDAEEALLRVYKEMLLRYRGEVLVFWHNGAISMTTATASALTKKNLREPTRAWRTRADVTALRLSNEQPVHDVYMGNPKPPFHKMPSISRRMAEIEEAFARKDQVTYQKFRAVR